MRPSKLSQSSLLQFTEGKFGDGRQEQAERRLALLQVENSLPFSVLEGAAMSNFCHCLRQDFVLPSRRTLQRRVHELYLDCK